MLNTIVMKNGGQYDKITAVNGISSEDLTIKKLDTMLKENNNCCLLIETMHYNAKKVLVFIDSISSFNFDDRRK